MPGRRWKKSRKDCLPDAYLYTTNQNDRATGRAQRCEAGPALFVSIAAARLARPGAQSAGLGFVLAAHRPVEFHLFPFVVWLHPVSGRAELRAQGQLAAEPQQSLFRGAVSCVRAVLVGIRGVEHPCPELALSHGSLLFAEI